MTSVTPYRAATSKPRLPPQPPPGIQSRDEAQRAGFDAAHRAALGRHTFEFPGSEGGRKGVWRVEMEVLSNTGIWWGCCPACEFVPDPPRLPRMRRAAVWCLWFGFLA